MTASAADHHAPSAGPRPPDRVRAFVYAGCFLALAALGFLFVTGQSFWLDEVRSGAKAVQPTFATFRTELLKTGGSDVQMPLYMGLLWAWARAFGTSEWTLRAINLVFFALSLLAVATARTLPRPRRLAWGMLCALAPLVAFYMDEARPYLLLFLGGTLVASALANPPDRGLPEPPELRRLLLGAVVLSGASLTGAVFAAWPCLWLFVRIVRDRPDRAALRRALPVLAATLLVLAALAGWFLWTLRAGYRGTQSYSTDGKTLAFAVYEFLGFAGVGPGRAALRSAPFGALRRFLFPLAAFAAVWAFFLGTAIRAGAMPRGKTLRHPLFVCAAAGALALLAGGVATHLRIVGRHLIPALPAFLLALAWALERAFRSGGRFGRAAALALCAAFLVSSISLRFASRHAKDDVRSAARLAREAAEAGSVVWWGGDKWTFEYYPPPREEARDRLRPFPAPGEALLGDQASRPDLAVLASKYDISDPDGSRRAILRALDLAPSSSLPGFDCYTPCPSP